MEKLIAYRSIDSEGDVWCEKVFIFKTDEDARKFFVPDNQILKDVFAEGGEIECMQVYPGRTDISIAWVEFWTEYAHDVKIQEMSAGYIITQ